MTPAAEMSDVQAAWLAGIIDGEGCIDMRGWSPRLRVKMSDHDVILRVAALMSDAPVVPEIYEGRKPLLCATVHGEKAVAVLRAVLPYLGSRRSAKATEVILTHEGKTWPGYLELLPAEDAA